MAKFAFNIYETSKYMVTIDADNIEEAKQLAREAYRKQDLGGFDQMHIKTDENWDILEMEQIEENTNE